MRSNMLLGFAVAGSIAAVVGLGAPAGADDKSEILNKLILDTEAEPDDGVAPLKVKFKTSADEPVQKPEYNWDFDDESPDSKEASPTHVFKEPGTYKVRVKLRDRASQKKGSDEVIVTVDAPEAVVPAAKAKPEAAKGAK